MVMKKISTKLLQASKKKTVHTKPQNPINVDFLIGIEIKFFLEK